MMRKMKRILLLFILLTCIPIASAYAVSLILVSPAGDLTSGTPVTVSFTIMFVSSGGQTFPPDSILDLYTELDNPRWSAVLALNNIDNPQILDQDLEYRKNIYFAGSILSYPSSDVKENLRVTLQGVAPTVTSTTNKTIIRIQELDNRNKVVSGSMVSVSCLVINTAEVSQLIATRESDLQKFKTHIDEKAALEIDTSTAEGKYSAALAAINDALSTPSSQYTAAYASLTNAQNLIIQGEKLLDKAWAIKDVSDAKVPLNNVDAFISIIKPNISSTDPRLSSIMSKREVAAGLLSVANDEISAGNYERAREMAQEAFTKGNESYNDALDLVPRRILSTTIVQITVVPTIVPTAVLTTILTTAPSDSVNKLLEEQNKKIEEQNKELEDLNKTIAEHNKKLTEQSGLLDQILNYFKRIFGWI